MMRKLCDQWVSAEDGWIGAVVGIAVLFGATWLFLAVTP